MNSILRRLILVALGASAPFLCTAHARQSAVELLHDQKFKDGFRAFWTAKSFDDPVHPDLKLGNVTANYTPYVNSYYGTAYTIHAWPENGWWNGTDWVTPDAGKYWNFNEGLHDGYADEGGCPLWAAYDPETGAISWNPFYDLAVHRIEANAQLIAWNEPDPLGNNGLVFIESFNNLYNPNLYYNPHYGGHIRTVYGNRNGTLYTYMNTQNEIHNIAADNGANYALDTWPHFILEQNFKQLIDPASFNTITFRAKLRVWDAQFSLPCAIWNWYFSNAVYGVGFTLRKKSNPYTVIFLQYNLYGAYHDNRPPGLDVPEFAIDQNGQGFYRGNVNVIGGPLVPDNNSPLLTGGTQKTIELRQFFGDAVQWASTHTLTGQAEIRRLEFIQTTLDDYYIAAVGIGWETIGWEEVYSQISEVSLQGVPR